MAYRAKYVSTMKRRYTVTLYNHAAETTIIAEGRTRRQAFKRALAQAGEPWLRAGERDVLTTLRTLFAEHVMSSYYRTAPHCHVSHPMGCGVEFRRT